MNAPGDARRDERETSGEALFASAFELAMRGREVAWCSSTIVHDLLGGRERPRGAAAGVARQWAGAGHTPAAPAESWRADLAYVLSRLRTDDGVLIGMTV
jgi:hypothetical protein